MLAMPGSAAKPLLQALGEALAHRKSKPNREHPRPILLSFVLKLNISTISSFVGGHSRVIRMNPNAASLVGASFNPVAFSETITAEEKMVFLAFVIPLGASPATREDIRDRANLFFVPDV